MKDRFKFRAWDNVSKTWHFNDLEVDDMYFEDFISVKNALLTFMQCTGIKDKNGKLIYESDIISFNGKLAIVEWDNGSACWWAKEHNCDSLLLVGFIYDSNKIIGNIYDNPELLK